MITSEKIDDLANALSKAQGMIGHAEKDSKNPHFKSSYPSLASVLDAGRRPLAENGLSMVQPLSRKGPEVVCTTRVMHMTGQWMEESISVIPAQETAQAVGSASTYLRRYQAMAMLGIAPGDDDGHEATFKPKPAVAVEPLKNIIDPESLFDGSKEAHKLHLKTFLLSEAIPYAKWEEAVTEMKGIKIGVLKAAVQEFKGDLAK